nr:MAG: hypothetical protein KatS3mg041_0526 [Bacteroidota bacterium]
MAEDLSHRFRERFFVPDGAIELRAFTHGLMPRTVPEMMARFLEDWRRFGVEAWNRIPNHWDPEDPTPVGWWNLPEYLGDRFIAPLIGAEAGTCILLPNVHWAVSALLSCPEPFLGRRRLVYTAAEFPSVSHTVPRWAQAMRWEAVAVPFPGSGSTLRAMLRAITTRTALVFVSRVTFLSGERLSDGALEAIAERCRQTGALLVLDGYHAVGAEPFRVHDQGIDLFVGGLLKEGCGSTGNGFLYIRPGLELTPRLGGWTGEGDPFAFGSEYRPHPVVRRRFLGGTPAIAPLYHAVEGVRILLEAGLEAIRLDNLAKTGWLIDALAPLEAEGLLEIISPRDDERRGPMLVLQIPEASRMASWLAQNGIFVDSRQNRRLRLAPFIWNSYDELAHVRAALEEALRTEAHLRDPIPTSGNRVVP